MAVSLCRVLVSPVDRRIRRGGQGQARVHDWARSEGTQAENLQAVRREIRREEDRLGGRGVERQGPKGREEAKLARSRPAQSAPGGRTVPHLASLARCICYSCGHASLPVLCCLLRDLRQPIQATPVPSLWHGRLAHTSHLARCSASACSPHAAAPQLSRDTSSLDSLLATIDPAPTSPCGSVLLSGGLVCPIGAYSARGIQQVLVLDS